MFPFRFVPAGFCLPALYDALCIHRLLICLKVINRETKTTSVLFQFNVWRFFSAENQGRSAQ